MFYQGGPIYHSTHVPGTLAQYIAESEYNAAYNIGMALENCGMINNDLLDKDIYVVP